MKKMILTGVVALSTLTGCQTLDSALAATGSVLNKTGDVLSGDFRGLAPAKQVTLTEIWKD